MGIRYIYGFVFCLLFSRFWGEVIAIFEGNRQECCHRENNGSRNSLIHHFSRKYPLQDRRVAWKPIHTMRRHVFLDKAATRFSRVNEFRLGSIQFLPFRLPKTVESSSTWLSALWCLMWTPETDQSLMIGGANGCQGVAYPKQLNLSCGWSEFMNGTYRLGKAGGQSENYGLNVAKKIVSSSQKSTLSRIFLSDLPIKKDKSLLMWSSLRLHVKSDWENQFHIGRLTTRFSRLRWIFSDRFFRIQYYGCGVRLHRNFNSIESIKSLPCQFFCCCSISCKMGVTWTVGRRGLLVSALTLGLHAGQSPRHDWYNGTMYRPTYRVRIEALLKRKGQLLVGRRLAQWRSTHSRKQGDTENKYSDRSMRSKGIVGISDSFGR